jgi:hypothetical protein
VSNSRRDQMCPTARCAKPVTFRVPVDINLSDFFDEPDCDFAACMLDTVHGRMISWKQDDDGYVRLQRRKFTRFIPERRFTRIRSTLVARQVIEVDHSYSVDRYSKGYRLLPQFLESREVECHDRRLARRINCYHQELEARLQPVHRWLKRKLGWLQFDQDLAATIIPTMRPDADSPMAELRYRGMIREQCKSLSPTQITRLIPDSYGRIHTPITRMPTILRRCLSIDGERLIGIDLKNSQPLIAGIVAERFLQSEAVQKRIIARRFSKRRNPYVRGEFEHIRRQRQTNDHKSDEHLPNMCCAGHSEAWNFGSNTERHVLGARPADLTRYKNLCESGLFYESLMEPGNDSDEHRNTVKREVFRDILFGEERYRSRLKDRFVAMFPTVAEILAQLKSRSYKHAARLMQSYESTLFIDIICRRFRRERPDLPIYTIHDAVLTTSEHVGYVKSVILDEFAKIGVSPGLKEERYG